MNSVVYEPFPYAVYVYHVASGLFTWDAAFVDVFNPVIFIDVLFATWHFCAGV